MSARLGRATRVASIIATVVTSIALATTASAKPHKVLILPVDGTADPATRAKLTATHGAGE